MSAPMLNKSPLDSSRSRGSFYVAVPAWLSFRHLNALEMRTWIAIFFLVLAGCGQQTRSSAIPAVTPKDEMDVITSFLQEHFAAHVPAGTPLVIEDAFFFAEADSHYGRSLLSEASDRVPAELIRDFCDKNAKQQAVWPELGSRLQLKLLSRAELDWFFSAKPDQKPDGWDRFYAKYPKSPGIITISRVGFNRRGDMAMLYVGSQYHWLAGSGQIHIFRKLNGKWIEESFSIGPKWVS